jgi:excisionase family DNA binding protein
MMANSDSLSRQIILESMGEMLTTEEAAKALGCHSATIRNWISEGRLRAYRIGPRLIRIKKADLEKLFNRYSNSSYN